jgi:hypothetical protein
MRIMSQEIAPMSMQDITERSEFERFDIRSTNTGVELREVEELPIGIFRSALYRITW